MYKTVYKYGTGDELPEGAKFLSTIVETIETDGVTFNDRWKRLVWHYFLVEVGAKK